MEVKRIQIPEFPYQPVSRRQAELLTRTNHICHLSTRQEDREHILESQDHTFSQQPLKSPRSH